MLSLLLTKNWLFLHLCAPFIVIKFVRTNVEVDLGIKIEIKSVARHSALTTTDCPTSPATHTQKYETIRTEPSFTGHLIVVWRDAATKRLGLSFFRRSIENFVECVVRCVCVWRMAIAKFRLRRDDSFVQLNEEKKKEEKNVFFSLDLHTTETKRISHSQCTRALQIE